MKIRNKPQNGSAAFTSSYFMPTKPRSLEKVDCGRKKRSLEGRAKGNATEASLRLLDRIAGFAKGSRGSLERSSKHSEPHQQISSVRQPHSFLKTSAEDEKTRKLPLSRREAAYELNASKASPTRYADLLQRKIVFTRESFMRAQAERSLNLGSKPPTRRSEPESTLNTFYNKKFAATSGSSRDQLRIPHAAKSTSPVTKRTSADQVLPDASKLKSISFRTLRGSPPPQPAKNDPAPSASRPEAEPKRSANSSLALFKQLEARKYARSIEKKETVKIAEQLHHRKDMQSEDKYPRNYMVQVNTFQSPPAPSPHTTLPPKPPTALEGTKNPYFKSLCEAQRDPDRSSDPLQQLREAFKTWKSTDHIEFFPFKTHQGLYKIIRRLGRGCFGEVLLAEQVLTGEKVALKKIPKNSIKNKDTRRKIDKEVLILKRLNGVNGVCRLFEVFEDEEFVYLVFELLPHGDLVKYFKENPLFEEDQLRVFFRKIMETMGEMHALGVLHRDIKLDNILLDHSLSPKVCDFGISTVVEEGKRVFDTGGTPAYLSPEVILAEGDVCAKSDVWSLGVLLYLLSNGVVPFKAQNVQVLYQKIIIGRYTFPANHTCSPELEDLINNMLVVDINQRFSVKNVLSHSWMWSGEGGSARSGGKIEPARYALMQEAVMLYLEQLGFPKSFLAQSLQKNAYNHVKACSDALLSKLKEQFSSSPTSSS